MTTLLRVGTHATLWLTAVCMTLWLSQDLRNSLLAPLEAEIDEIAQEITREAGFWAAFEEDEAYLLDSEDLWDSEDFADYRAIYIELIEEVLDEIEDEDEAEEEINLLLARLRMLGEPVELEASIQPGRIWRLMLEETPEAFHDHLERFMDEDRWRMEHPELNAEMLHHWLRETFGDAEEVTDCFALLDADRRSYSHNLREIPPLIFSLERDQDPGLLEVYRAWEDDDESLCLARWLFFEDGSGALLGTQMPPAFGTMETAQQGLLLALLLLGTLACVLIYRRERRTVRQQRAVLRLAQQARGGDFSPRLPVEGNDPEALINQQINSILEKAGSLVERLNGITANIAHDLRTPLTRLRGQIDLLLHASQRDPAIISAVQAEADQLLDTFNALLRISQVDSGALQAGFRPFDLCALLRDACELYAPAFEEKGIHFSSELSARALIIRGDMDLWMQSLSNLLDNALKYVPKGQSVQVSLDAGGALVVQDSGPGIPDLELDKVLDRFYRLPKHRGEQGNGLGLSLVAAVCKLHDASLTLRNQSGLRVEMLVKLAQ